MHRLLVSTLAVGFVVVGCKDDKKTKQAAPYQEKSSATAGSQPENRPDTARNTSAAKSWTPQKRSDFCRRAFDVGAVSQLLGFPGVDVSKVKRVMADTRQARTAACQYTLPGEPRRAPKYYAELTIDCRRGVVHDAAMIKRQVNASRKDLQKTEDVNIGDGGTYVHHLVKMGDRAYPFHQLSFVHTAPRCTIRVTTRFVDANHTTALAKHVSSRVDKDSAPQ